MYGANPGGRPNSWAPHDDHSRSRVPPMWPPDERYRARDDQMIPHPLPERGAMIPAEMAMHAGQQPQPGDHMYHPMPPPPHMDHYGMPQQIFHQQPAPRQRTAIACRYCRRRKIRCSGFDSSPDGRCSNCLRFSQECVFTPVSSQTHAFVPAHTQYPHLKQAYARNDGRPYAQLYGPHGQPLNMSIMPPHPPAPEYMHPGYGRPPSPGPANGAYPRPYDPAAYDRDRERDYRAPPNLPPLNQPNGYPPDHPAQRRGSAGDYPPMAWRHMPAHQPGHPPSPPTTLPAHPRQFTPPPLRGNANGVYPTATYPPSSQSMVSSQTPFTSADSSAYPSVATSSQLPAPVQAARRTSDQREQDPRDPRYQVDNSTAPSSVAVPPSTAINIPNASSSTSALNQASSAPRSSSTGPPSGSTNPMNLQNLIIDPASQSRSAADHKMLSSLSWKP